MNCDQSHEDFFVQTCRIMGIEWVGAKLGWKSKGDGAKRNPWNQLKSYKDFDLALAHFNGLKNNTHWRKPVIMEVADLVSCYEKCFLLIWLGISYCTIRHQKLWKKRKRKQLQRLLNLHMARNSMSSKRNCLVLCTKGLTSGVMYILTSLILMIMFLWHWRKSLCGPAKWWVFLDIKHLAFPHCNPSTVSPKMWTQTVPNHLIAWCSIRSLWTDDRAIVGLRKTTHLLCMSTLVIINYWAK